MHRMSFGDKMLSWSIYFLLSILAFVTFYPFWNAAVISFNNGMDTVLGELPSGPATSHWTIIKSCSRIQGL